jgi:5-methylcytosine-specific restriction protein A
MARRTLHACPTPGCPEVVEAGRCDGCKQQAERVRGTARQRGYDNRWQRVRRRYLQANPQCAEPGCIEQATDVDHIDGHGPRGPRGYDWGNLRGLCHRHHSQRTARDQPGGWAAG